MPAPDTLTGTQSLQSGKQNITIGVDDTVTGKILLESDDDSISTLVTDETALKDNSTPVVMTPVATTFANGTYGAVIPYLVKTYNLKDTDKTNPKFTRVSVKNSLYSSFATAYSKGMIGTNIDPGTKVSCDTYLVLK